MNSFCGHLSGLNVNDGMSNFRIITFPANSEERLINTRFSAKVFASDFIQHVGYTQRFRLHCEFVPGIMHRLLTSNIDTIELSICFIFACVILRLATVFGHRNGS